MTIRNWLDVRAFVNGQLKPLNADALKIASYVWLGQQGHLNWGYSAAEEKRRRAALGA